MSKELQAWMAKWARRYKRLLRKHTARVTIKGRPGGPALKETSKGEIR